jgi:hypothetical protein
VLVFVRFEEGTQTAFDSIIAGSSTRNFIRHSYQGQSANVLDSCPTKPILQRYIE